MCDFVCETMSHVQYSLHWSVIHYQVTFERHSGPGSETPIIIENIGHFFFCLKMMIWAFT